MGRETQEADVEKQGRTVGLVIAIAMSLWIAAQWVGPAIGLSGRYAFLADFAVLAALIWAMVNIYQMWRKRHADKG